MGWGAAFWKLKVQKKCHRTNGVSGSSRDEEVREVSKCRKGKLGGLGRGIRIQVFAEFFAKILSQFGSFYCVCAFGE